MSVTQVKDKSQATKDGKTWYFYQRITLLDGYKKAYKSKKYATKKEAQIAEREFLNSVERHEFNPCDMTWKALYDEFYEYKKDRVKITTMRTYRERDKYFYMLHNIKLNNLNISHYQEWRSFIQKQELSLKTKNSLHKLFKEILNYGMKWHNLNYNSLYMKMEKFTDPNGLPKEMDFYTFEEFQKFINAEDKLKYKAIFETLYYCGLRRGELRGLTWDNIDFANKILSVRKSIINIAEEGGRWQLSTPKTKTSIRDIPMPDILIDHLKILKEEEKTKYGFENNWFVFGDVKPIHQNLLLKRKKAIAKRAELREIRIHDFRHSCASLLINNGANIMIIAKYLGHSKIDETLNTYSHLFKSKMNDVVNLVNNLTKNYKK